MVSISLVYSIFELFAIEEPRSDRVAIKYSALKSINSLECIRIRYL